MTSTEKHFDVAQLVDGLFKWPNRVKSICNRKKALHPEKKSDFFMRALQLTLVGSINLKIEISINPKSTCALSFNGTCTK